nr:Gag-Pol polyprotein [Tanacetum cinerariifolium]
VVWELVPLPGGRKPIRNKWVYKIKKNGDDQVERYRARLVVKGYAQKEGIDFNEIISHDGDVSSIVCISSGKFNVRDDLYKTRHCTCSGSSESIHSGTWHRALGSCEKDP